MLDKLRRHIVEIANMLVVEGLVKGTSGNVSARDVETGLVVITPTGMRYDIMRPEDVCVVRLNGEVLEGGTPSSSLKFHLRVMNQRPDVLAIVHTHSPAATAFAIAGECIPVINIDVASKIKGTIHVVPYAENGSDEEAENVVSGLGSSNAVLIGNHGVVAVGNSLDRAFLNAVIVEQAARMYALVRAMGLKPVVIQPRGEQG